MAPQSFFGAISLHLPLILIQKSVSIESAIYTSHGDGSPLQPKEDHQTVERIAANGTIVVAEWSGSGCLYPGRILEDNEATAIFRYDFDEIAELSFSQIYHLFESNARVNQIYHIKVPNRQAWIPATIRVLDGDRAQVTPDKSASCSAEVGKPTIWVPVGNILDAIAFGGRQ